MTNTREQPEAGSRRSDGFRYGPDAPVMGMRRRGDPGSIRLPFFEFLQNVRFNDGIGGRPGTARMLNGLSDVGNGEVQGLYDFQMTGPAGKLYVIYAGVPALCGTVTGADGDGRSLNWFDQEKATPLSAGPWWNTDTWSVPLCSHEGALYVGRGSELHAFISIEPDYDDQNLFLGGLSQTELLRTFDGFTISTLCSAFGLLFIGLDGGAGASKIVIYDGTTYTDDDTALDTPVCMKLFRDEQLVVTFSTQDLHWRDELGNWTTVVEPALGGAQMFMASYRDTLYISQQDTDIWKWDGTAVTNDHTVAGAEINGLAWAFEFLFFAYKGAGNEAIIGRLDENGTYVDAHVNLTDQFDWAESAKLLAYYRDTLTVGVLSTEQGGRILQSPGNNTDGDYELGTPLATGPAVKFGDILAFEIF